MKAILFLKFQYPFWIPPLIKIILSVSTNQLIFDQILVYEVHCCVFEKFKNYLSKNYSLRLFLEAAELSHSF